MKPIYKSLALAAMTLQVSVSLQAQVTDGTATSQIDVPAEVLDSLRVELISPNVSGARDLIRSGECTVNDNALSITLNAGDWLKGGVYRLQVVATFGTQTQVIYALDVTVPRYETLASEPQEYEDTVTVVSTFGDGDKSGADATVYAKDGDGNAHVTTPLSIGNGVATGAGSIASGYADGDGSSIQASSSGSIAVGDADGEGSIIQSTGDGAIASGYASEGAIIQSTGDGAIAVGNANEGAIIKSTGDGAIAVGNAREGSSIESGSEGSIASGYANEGASIQASGKGSIASGYANEGASIVANNNGSIASGYAYGEGSSIESGSEGSIAIGSAYEGASIQANGTGSIAIGSDYEGASIQANGNGSIASGSASDSASIQASGNGSIASGYADASNGSVEASGLATHAFGIGVKATQDAQMVVGKCNVVDEDDSFAFIVGNGTDDEHRKNAFAVTKSGELALFEADGTPVILDAATLKALIASLQ